MLLTLRDLVIITWMSKSWSVVNCNVGGEHVWREVGVWNKSLPPSSLNNDGPLACVGGERHVQWSVVCTRLLPGPHGPSLSVMITCQHLSHHHQTRQRTIHHDTSLCHQQGFCFNILAKFNVGIYETSRPRI